VLAVRTRLAGSAAPARVVAFGEVVRGMALLGLLAQAVLAAAALVTGLPEALRRPGGADSQRSSVRAAPSGGVHRRSGDRHGRCRSRAGDRRYPPGPPATGGTTATGRPAPPGVKTVP
jgi:hypothetical protein